MMFRVFLHFADFQNSQLRQFNVSFNGGQLVNYSPMYLKASSVQTSGWWKSADGNYNITLEATNTSLLPPMISAYEIYRLIPTNNSRTFSKDCELSPRLSISKLIGLYLLKVKIPFC
jgi:hypothetical protein